ncbi:DUF4983 domain-containing protein [Arenibacter aquaticus]|uniref:DUF4983 domain-containing protein n=1 Tax=Arenibacter aquaticus TaxID=2489054 RepID=A0A430K7Y3_9FLAO|nr:alkaline phosphatase family protein [Arenibacter aquaticus]RTE55160.1 DUF4983 domain-containing protein [Arenibacter aquaticus]
MFTIYTYCRPKIIVFLAISFAISLVGACASEEKEKEAGKVGSGKKPKLLIIGIDGCRPDGITTANTPSLDALMANGTYSLDARNTGITISGPSWSSMLTGVWEDKHGVVDNSFSGSNYTEYPHFFKRIEAFSTNYKTVSVSQWHPINDQMGQRLYKTVNTEDSSENTKLKAIDELKEEGLTALFVHFDDVDHAGHRSGFGPDNPAYLQAIETVDKAIGEVVQAMKSRSNYENEDWVILVSTDHGGIGTSHGGDTDEERTIFVIVSGDTVPKKEIAKTTVEVVRQPVSNCLGSSDELFFDANASIEVPNNPAFNFGASNDFSIECRVRSLHPGDVAILAKKNWDNGLMPGYVFSFNPRNKKFKVNVGDGSKRVDVEASTLDDNEWHTLSATFDRDGLLKVYMDGELENSADISKIENIDNDFPFTIGGDGNLKYNLHGYIAEVRVFNTLLDDEEIDLWQCKVLDASHPKYAFVKGHWKITEGQGQDIKDLGPVRANGRLKDGIWQDATVASMEVEHNFDNTPRTVDLAVTALNHLCVPIDPNWGLEGNSLLEFSCD